MHLTSLSNTGSVTDMSYMFQNAYKFNSSIAGWDVSKVKNFEKMFFANPYNGATMFNGNLSTWNTGAVTSMHGMFSSEGLTLRAGFNNPSIANWNTSNVRNMRLMFGGYRYGNCGWASSPFNQEISNWNWDISSVQICHICSSAQLTFGTRAFGNGL